MTARRKLRREWERRGYTVTEAGHGRVRDAAGRLVATYALTPGTQRSARADWCKLANPAPHGCVGGGDEAPAPGPAEAKQREHYRPVPREPRMRTVPGFEFPEFEIPQRPAWTPAAVVAEAVVRREAERRRAIPEGHTCDRCLKKSGADTRIVCLDGTREKRVAWFMQLDRTMTQQEAERLASRENCRAQLCESCAEDMVLANSATFGQLDRLSRCGDPDRVFRVGVVHVGNRPADIAFRKRISEDAA